MGNRILTRLAVESTGRFLLRSLSTLCWLENRDALGPVSLLKCETVS